MVKPALDRQVGGNHYKNFEYQPIEFLMDISCNTALGYAIKYISRFPNKNPDDLEKAAHCIQIYREWVIKENKISVLMNQANLDFNLIKKFTSQFEPRVQALLLDILALADMKNFLQIATGDLKEELLNTDVALVITSLKELNDENRTDK